MDVVAELRKRDKAIREHHEFRTGRPMPQPFTLEAMAADEIERLRLEVDAAYTKGWRDRQSSIGAAGPREGSMVLSAPTDQPQS